MRHASETCYALAIATEACMHELDGPQFKMNILLANQFDIFVVINWLQLTVYDMFSFVTCCDSAGFLLVGMKYITCNWTLSQHWFPANYQYNVYNIIETSIFVSSIFFIWYIYLHASSINAVQGQHHTRIISWSQQTTNI